MTMPARKRHHRKRVVRTPAIEAVVAAIGVVRWELLLLTARSDALRDQPTAAGRDADRSPWCRLHLLMSCRWRNQLTARLNASFPASPPPAKRLSVSTKAGAGAM